MLRSSSHAPLPLAAGAAWSFVTPKIEKSGESLYHLRMGTGISGQDAQVIPFVLARGSRRRKRLAIRVSRDGAVEVLLPWRGGIREALDAVRVRAQWIARHVLEAQDRPRIEPYAYLPGERHFYLGRPVFIDILDHSGGAGEENVRSVLSGRRRVWLDGDRLCMRLPDAAPEKVRKALDGWFRMEAAHVFSERLTELGAAIPWLHTLPPLRIKAMRRRWGSCTRTGELTLNMHLVKAPRRCIDYVLLHEIAHLREHNHSKRYYGVLQELMPDWQKARQDLERISSMVLQS